MGVGVERATRTRWTFCASAGCVYIKAKNIDATHTALMIDLKMATSLMK